MAALVVVAVAVLTALAQGHPHRTAAATAPPRTLAVTTATRTTTTTTARAAATPTGATGGAAPEAPSPSRPARTVAPRAPFRIVEVTVRLTDPHRTMRVSGRVVPRSFLCEFRFGTPGRRVPLVVFGHGYAVSPEPYRALLDSWVRAGYVVAAPVFPLENVNAPGGPYESDLPNQAADMSLVISSLARPRGSALRALARRADLRHIAVTGQSDGGDTALAAADDPAVRDRRITAAMILSGAEDPFVRLFAMPADGPPLLAVQGTADTINPPSDTARFYDEAGRPKYLLRLIGAGHLPPYAEPGAARTEVKRVTIAFLDRYLKGRPAALRRYAALGSAGPATAFLADP